jgi:ribonuclease P protein component
MLSRTARLSRHDFARYFASGRRYQSPALTVLYTPHTRLMGTVVVSKKVSKSAVVRNTLRRRLYATLQTYAKVNGCAGVVIVVAKPTLATLPRTAQHEALTSLLSQALKSR